MERNKSTWIYSLIMMGFVLILTNSCKKDINVPELFTTQISAITETSAMCGGYINKLSDKDASITERGVCWSTNQNPTISDNKTSEADGSGSFTSSITGLNANTTYYVKAYATNKAGTGYGNTISFTTSPVTDFDGNVYHTVTIGTQVWMLENLRVTHYRDGSEIPNITVSVDWVNLASGAYCVYNNDTYNADVYGLLYNWYAVHDSRNIAPIGWHVPCDAEWTLLTNYLGGTSVAGGKLKQSGTEYWASPNTGATDESGFRALPAGYFWGDFVEIGASARFWTSFENVALDRTLYYLYTNVSSVTHVNSDGASVRCIKD